MAAVTKILSIALLALGGVACAVSTGATKREKSGKEIYPDVTNEEIIQLAHQKMKRAIAHLEQRVVECHDNKGMKTVVPAHVLPALPLSEKEWGTALAYLSYKAIKSCEGNTARGDALMALAQFLDIEKQLTGANTIDTSPYTVDLLCCIGETGSVATELRYLKIAPEIRQRLESVPELNQPFNPIKTFEAMRR